mmetsp:Transcript_18946/g.55635  ORF Transcript_18946/g.55635 Transcript_18946/m.55635 type:complete len:270 (+) Transcript_18946:256-1065(+)
MPRQARGAAGAHDPWRPLQGRGQRVEARADVCARELARHPPRAQQHAAEARAHGTAQAGALGTGGGGGGGAHAQAQAARATAARATGARELRRRAHLGAQAALRGGDGRRRRRVGGRGRGGVGGGLPGLGGAPAHRLPLRGVQHAPGGCAPRPINQRAGAAGVPRVSQRQDAAAAARGGGVAVGLLRRLPLRGPLGGARGAHGPGPPPRAPAEGAPQAARGARSTALRGGAVGGQGADRGGGGGGSGGWQRRCWRRQRGLLQDACDPDR